MINGISDRQSTHLVQEPRSCVQTKARMLCFCMRHLPRPPLCTQKRDEIVRWTENKSSGDSLLWTKSDNIPGRVKARKEEQPPPPRTFFLLQTLFGKGTLLSQCSLHPRVSVIGVMSGKLDKLLGEGGKLTCDWLASHWEEYSWVPTFYEQPEHHEI